MLGLELLRLNLGFGSSHPGAMKAHPEAESKEKHGVWDPMPELTIISPYVNSRIDSNTFTMGNPMPESALTLCQSRLYHPVRDFGFGLYVRSQRLPSDRGKSEERQIENVF